MGSTLSVTHLRGLTSGNDANKIYVDSDHSIIGTNVGQIYAPGMVVGSQRTEMTGTTYSNSNSLFSVGVTVNYTPKFVGSLLQVRHVAWVRSAGSGTECRLRWEVKRTVNSTSTVVCDDRAIGQYDYDNSGGIWLLNTYEVFEEHTTTTTAQHSWAWRMRTEAASQGNGGVYFNENFNGDRISFVHIQEIAQ